MESLHLFFHSPFTERSVTEGDGPALLLQFILQEVVKEQYLSEEAPPLMAPFDWAWRQGSMYKVREHGLLMPAAFAGMGREVKAFLNGMRRPRQELVRLLEPFIWRCRKSDGLLLFLVRHKQWFGEVLKKICPEELSALRRRFRSKGLVVSIGSDIA
jgi:hypothetical protein